MDVGHLIINYFKPLPHKANFLFSKGKSILKTMWEKEKMLLTSIFSFCYNEMKDKMKDKINVLSNIQCYNVFNLQNAIILLSGEKSVELLLLSLCLGVKISNKKPIMRRAKP